MTTTMADWQHGYALADLRALAAPFRASNAPHVYGAFGLTKERDIAAALAEQRCSWVKEADQIAVVALSRVLKVASHASDFRGEAITIPAGDHAVSDLGWTPEIDLGAALPKLLDGLWRRSAAPAQWVESFAEDRALAAALEALGFRLLARKVTAGSEIKHVACRAQTPGDLQRREASCCAALAAYDRVTLAVLAHEIISPAQQAAILDELRAYSTSAWMQHYSSYNKRESWTAFALRGFDPADPGFIVKPAEMSKKWKAEHPARLAARADWTSAAAQFPQTRAALAAILGGREPERVRLMKLAPGGGELARHADITDREAGTRDGALVRLHIPLVTHPEVRFTAWTAEGARLDRFLPERALCYLDQRKPHTVVNASPQDRVHLVSDVPADTGVRGWLMRAWLEEDPGAMGTPGRAEGFSRGRDEASA